MQKDVDAEKGVATCILCGKLLQEHEVVKYRDWYAHSECAQDALKRQVGDFDKTPFRIGSVGMIFGVILATPIFLAGVPLMDPTAYLVAFLGMAICLGFQAFGFYGFGSNYDEITGIICTILAAVSAISHLVVSILFLQYGYNPQYYDPETGALMLQSIPSLSIGIFLSFGLLLLLMVMTAIMILLVGESATWGFDNRIIAVIFIGSGALMPLTPINFFVEMILVTALFLSAKVPDEWKKLEAI